MTVLALLAGCVDDFPEHLADLQVSEAELRGVDGAGVHLIGGTWSGSGTLAVTTTDGDRLELPVNLAAGSAGLLLDVTATANARIALDLPRDPVSAAELFGTYRGSRESLVLLFGAVGLHLENDAGVRIDETSLGLGLGLAVAWTALTITELEPEHTGASADTGQHSGSAVHSGDDDHSGATTGDTGSP